MEPKDTEMTKQEREGALEKLHARRQEIRRALTSVEQQIQRTNRQVLVIQQQIASLSKGRHRAA
jgi:hypothetical protein